MIVFALTTEWLSSRRRKRGGGIELEGKREDIV
jgi:hypothetical protein